MLMDSPINIQNVVCSKDFNFLFISKAVQDIFHVLYFVYSIFHGQDNFNGSIDHPRCYYVAFIGIRGL